MCAIKAWQLLSPVRVEVCLGTWGYRMACFEPAHKKELLTYLKSTGLKLGFLLNFGDELMQNGITRTINGILDE